MSPYILHVLSGKGGVGKSTLSVLISLYISKCGLKVALLDLDLCGPSMSVMFGLNDVTICKNDKGSWLPHRINSNLSCLSMSFLLASPDSCVIWRGARKNALIKELCTNVEWGNPDILVIDTPPGIQEEHISLAEIFYDNPNVSAIMITTPHGLSIDDINRQITFCKRTGIKIIGIVENMKKLECSNCHECYNLFQNENVQNFCIKSEQNYIGYIDILPNLSKMLDCGENIFENYHNMELEELLNKIKNLLIS